MKKALCICQNALTNNHSGTQHQFSASTSINNINDNEIQDESTIIDLRPVVPGLMNLSMLQSQSRRTPAAIGVSTTSIHNMQSTHLNNDELLSLADSKNSDRLNSLCIISKENLTQKIISHLVIYAQGVV